MARPRRDEEDVLLDRIAQHLQTRTSLTPWTLAEVADAARLSPSGLIKRFGSRKNILIKLSRAWIDSVPESRVDWRDPEAELTTWVSQRFSRQSADGIAQGLTHLIDDLVDDDLRALLIEGWEREITYIAALLTALTAVPREDARSRASLLFDALNGSMLRQPAPTLHDSPETTLRTFLEAWA